MKKIAFLFPGQGSQSVGMGRDFFESYEPARRTFHLADEILGFAFSRLMFEGPLETITKTEYAQLAIYITSLAIVHVIQEQYPHIIPYVCAGLSVGEYSALTAAGYVDFSHGLKLVSMRARFMSEACEEKKGSMAAILGMENRDLESIVHPLIDSGKEIWIANFNCPQQIVISGSEKAIEEASILLKAAGARRIVPLQVHGAFHSGFMISAQRKLEPWIQQCPVLSSPIRITMNVPGDYVDSIEEIKQYMIRQVTASVRWQQSIEMMRQSGIDQFIEIGVGKTLMGMNRKMGLAAETIALEKIEDLTRLAEI